MSRDELREELHKIWSQWSMARGAHDQIIMRPDAWLQAQFEILEEKLKRKK